MCAKCGKWKIEKKIYPQKLNFDRRNYVINLYNAEMGARRYGEDIKKRVEKLREMGKTYAEIRKEIPVPKSTLSAWLGEKYKGIFDRKAQLAHLKRARILAAARLRRDKAVRDAVSAKRGKETASSLGTQDIAFRKALLSMLYWAEGAKAGRGNTLKFVNTDPRLAKLYITLLRSCFSIDEKRVRIRLHLHYYHNKVKAVRFWSKLLDVPSSQFGKLYVKSRSKTRKFRKNFTGICFISYSDTGIFNEVLALAYTLHDKIVLPTIPNT